jgi:glucose 1-dehydrogenase
MTTPYFAARAALITGAGEGIGLEIARQLALRGTSVLLNDLDPARTAAAERSLREQGGACFGVAGDVAEVAFVRSLVDRSVEHFGRLDFVVANAGITQWRSFLEYEPAEFDRILAVNLRGSFFLAQAGARQMCAQGEGGRIVLMSSVTGERAIPRASAYSMTKAALRMLARSLVSELSQHRITVNAIAPGATTTPRNLADEPDYEEVWRALTPLQRPASARDIADAVLFLLSPKAAHITGQTLTVDGGWSVVSTSSQEDG